MSITLKNAELDVSINSFEDFERFLDAINFPCIEVVNDGGLEGATNGGFHGQGSSMAMSIWLIRYAARNIEGYIAVRPSIEAELESALDTIKAALQRSKRNNELLRKDHS